MSLQAQCNAMIFGYPRRAGLAPPGALAITFLRVYNEEQTPSHLPTAISRVKRGTTSRTQPACTLLPLIRPPQPGLITSHTGLWEHMVIG